MNSDRMPSRSEVIEWGPQQLADYLRRMSLFGCDKAVLKHSISGIRFVNLSDNDLQKFPKLHAPMISKLSTEISKKEERRGLFRMKTTTPKYHEPAAEVQGWGDDEFDDVETEDDYESPDSGDKESSDGDYEHPNDDLDDAGNYEPPPTEPEDLGLKQCPTLPVGDSDYIDNRDNHVSSRCLPPVVSPRPPVAALAVPPPRMPGQSSPARDHSPHSAGRPSGKYEFPMEPPQIFRGNKPGRESGSAPPTIRGPNTPDKAGVHSRRPQMDIPDTHTWPKPPALPPMSTSVGRSNSSVRPPLNRVDMKREQTPDDALKHNTFPLVGKSLHPHPGPPGRYADCLPPGVGSAGSLPLKMGSAMANHRGSFTGSDWARPPPSRPAYPKELDPSWYVGEVTRKHAEECLKQVNKDGTFLVRDSTRQLASQPFTLMVLYQDKVYNIQIRKQNQVFQLGTGLKVQEFFQSVCGIIRHYSQSPLLLIDAKNRTPGQQNQCQLSHPAGYYMAGPN
ncbi:lymphocyte cytosolic protein 2a isoform 2-T2 [Aulostomus maculatus]